MEIHAIFANILRMILTSYQLIVIISIDRIWRRRWLRVANSVLIGKIHMDCPICNMLHEVEERTRMTSTFMKGEKVFYEEHFYICTNNSSTSNSESPGDQKDSREFQPESLVNSNQMAARNAYRRTHDLLTSDEIVAVRENYGLTQVEAARLLGWGEATIARYESKAIQDEAYDTMLRIIQENPLQAIALLDKNSDKFPEPKRMQIRTRMVERLDSYGKEFLSRQVFAGEYVKFSVPSDFNGYKLLDIDKVESVVSYFAERIADLYKIQLVNLLWYADALFFKTCGNSMTGLVYRHESMGMMPIGHASLTGLKNVIVQAEEDYESSRYRFYQNAALDPFGLSKNETAVLDTTIAKFRNYDAALMVSYVQEEAAYTQTGSGNIIPYSLAKKMRAL